MIVVKLEVDVGRAGKVAVVVMVVTVAEGGAKVHSCLAL